MNFVKTICVVGISVAFALAADPCKDKSAEAKQWVAKCKSIGKGNPGFESCSDSYKVAKSQAEQACRSKGLNEDEVLKAIAQWEKQVDKCKGKVSSRCDTALQQLEHYQNQLDEIRAQNR